MTTTAPTATAPRTSPRTGLHRLVALLGILTMAVLVSTVSAGSAQASTWSQGGTVTSGAFCNRYTHSMTMQGSIVLSTRFPNGARVATRYAYFYVNPSTLARTSGNYVTGWLYSTASPSSQYIPPTALGGDYTISNISSNLPTYRINTWGALRVMTQVGVWNGSSYEYSNWDLATGYDNFGQFGIYSYNSVCLGSVT